MHVDNRMYERISAFGETALDALLPLLGDPDPEIRNRAGFLISSFRRIDPRYLPVLAEAWRPAAGRGNGWLPRAIAATGTDEALALLWRDFLRDPDHGSNSQVHFALARFDAERLRPLVVDRLADCEAQGGSETCLGLFALLARLRPPFPQWSIGPLVALSESSASEEVREWAQSHLVQLRQPAGLAAYQRRLAALAAAPPRRPDGDWDLIHLIGGIERFGEAGRDSGPLIARYLGSDHDEELRAAAALALGRIGDSSSVPALVGLEDDLWDDWLLAYNVAESLGRLRAGEARPLLERLQGGHWHRGVRNNAGRALNALAGGAFARAGVAGDGAPYPPPRDGRGNEYLYFGGLRFAGDDAARRCASEAEASQRIGQDPVGTIRWPRRGLSALEFADVGESTRSGIRRRIGVREVQGDVVAVLPVRSGLLVAFNGGEFGGGLYHLPVQGPPRRLFDEPVTAAWLVDNRLYVAAGLAHLMLDRGHVYAIDPDRLRVERVVLLPASPRRVFVSSGRAVVIETGAGDLALGEDGRPLDPAPFGDCGDQ